MDNPNFINYYIDILIGTMNDAVVRNVSLQANLKIANETIEEQNERLSSLESTVHQMEENKNKTENERIMYLESELNNFRNGYNDLINMKSTFENTKHQLEHLESFKNQIIVTNEELRKKEELISSLQQTIDDLSNPKRKKKVVVPKEEVVVVEEPPKETKKPLSLKDMVKKESTVAPKQTKVNPNDIIEDGGSF